MTTGRLGHVPGIPYPVPARDPAQLWAAYPEGLLARPGVVTVHGWRCWGIGPWRSRRYHAPIWVNEDGIFFDGDLHGEHGDGDGYASTNFRQAVADGDLLPLVDERETATWACLLRELAEATELPEAHQRADPGHRWWVDRWAWGNVMAEGVTVETPEQKRWVPGWTLGVASGSMGMITLFQEWALETRDSGQALLEARAQLRGTT